MMSLGEKLIQTVQNFKQRTGEESMVVMIENHDQAMAVHRIEYDTHAGLLVDGKPPSVQWYQDAEVFHPMQWAPAVLH